MEEVEWLLGQLVGLKIAPFDVERLKIEASVRGWRKYGLLSAIVLMLAAAVIFVDETMVIVGIECPFRD